MKTIFNRNNRLYPFLSKLLFVILISVVVYIYGIIQLEYTPKYIDYTQMSEEVNVTETIKSGDVIEQEIEIISDNVVGVSVAFATHQNKVTAGKVTARILDQNENIISEQEIDATNIEDNSYLDIFFENSEKLNTGEVYILSLTFENIENQTIACWLSSDNDLVMKEIVEGRDLFSKTFTLIMIGFLILICVVYTMINYFQIDLWKVYILAGAFLGLLYLLIIPIYVVPDEPSHLYSAYQVSNSMFGIDMTEDGTIMMRRDDAECVLEAKNISRLYYDQYYDKVLNLSVKNDEMVSTANEPVSTYSYLYFISGFGITLGRLLQLATVPTYLLGALFNYLLFFFAVIYSIKKIPFGKTVVFLWALLPMTLQQTSSFSYDAIVFSLSVIIISLSLRLAYVEREKIKKNEWIVLFICVMLLAPVKGYALLPLCILPFLIFIKKRNEDKKILYYTIGLAVGLVIIICTTICFNNYGSANLNEDSDEEIVTIYSGEQGFTIEYLIQHPMELFTIICNTIYKNGDFYFNTLLGNSLGWFELNIPLFSVLPYFVMLILAGMKRKEEALYLGKGEKVYLNMLAVMGISLACVGMLLTWTPITAEWIEGIQGRYFLPFIMLPFLTIRSNKIEVDADVDKKIIFSAVWLEMIVFLFIYLRAL